MMLATLEGVQALRRQANYRAARSLAQRVLDAGGPNPDVAVELGRLHEEFGDYSEAEAVLRRGLTSIEQFPPGRTQGQARVSMLAMLVRVRRSQGRYAEAQPVADDALRILAATPSLLDLDACEPLVDIGRLRLDLDDLTSAEELFARAADIAERATSGPDQDAAAAAAHGARGGLERVRGHYTSAEALLRRAIALGETAFGPASLEVAGLLNDLGIVFKFSGRFADAKPLYLRALEILEDGLGGDAPDVASVYHNLGGLEHARGDYVAAEPYGRRAFLIREKALGSKHVAVASDRAAYASIIDRLGRDVEAEEYFRQALAVYEEAFGKEHVEIAVNLNNLGAILLRRGDLGRADSLFRRSIVMKEQLLGSSHPALANNLNNLAACCRRRGDPAEAESLYRRALLVLDAGVEPDHPTVRTTLRNYARLLTTLDRAQEAAVLVARAESLTASPSP